MNWLKSFFKRKSNPNEVVVRFYIRDTGKLIDIYCIRNPLTTQK